MTEIDLADDDSLRFVQRVLESAAPESDRADARKMIVDIRTRIRRAQPEPTGSHSLAIDALRYYRDECSGAEPSISVFHQMLDEAMEAQPEPAAPSVVPMTVLDIADDDALRFVQRVLESNAPESDRNAARQMVSDIRTRVRQTASAAPSVAPEQPKGDGA